MDLPGPHTSVLEHTSAPPHAGFPSRVCLITLSGSLFAIDLQSIREVFPVDSVTPVPGMPTVLTGVTNLRGVVVPLVDVRSLLGLQHSGAFFFQAEDGIRDYKVTGVQTCALPI